MAVAVLFGSSAVAASLAVAPGRLGVAGASLAVIAVIIVVIDRRAFIIPDPLNLAAFLIGFTAAVLSAPGEPEAAIGSALLRAAVMFLAFFVFRVGYRRLRGVQGLGMGDVKLAAVAGVWLDWVDLPVAVDVAAVAALGAALLRRWRGEDLNMQAKLPFGAFLAPAIWLCWLLAAWRGQAALATLSTGR
jgi:leader peptidase (prepilin peptidase)/N-methyltransferase